MSLTKRRYYAGIGSRQTPLDICDMMRRYASLAETRGLVLRSGAAPGADEAFESGLFMPPRNAEIWLPWDGFGGRFRKDGYLVLSNDSPAFATVEEFHPAPGRLCRAASRLMARNAHQVLGGDLHTPVDFVLCWAPEDSAGNVKGGTGQAVRIALTTGILVVNLWRPKNLTWLTGVLLNTSDCVPCH